MFKKILTLVVFCFSISNSQDVKVVDVSCEFNPIATKYSHKSWNSKMIKITWPSGGYVLNNSDDGEALIPSQMDILDYTRIFNDKDKMYPIINSELSGAILLYVETADIYLDGIGYIKNSQRFDIKYDKNNKIEALYSQGKFVCIVGE